MAVTSIASRNRSIMVPLERVVYHTQYQAVEHDQDEEATHGLAEAHDDTAQ